MFATYFSFLFKIYTLWYQIQSSAKQNNSTTNTTASTIAFDHAEYSLLNHVRSSRNRTNGDNNNEWNINNKMNINNNNQQQHSSSYKQLNIAAYYYPWYGIEQHSGRNRHWDEGFLRNDLDMKQLPLLGYYDSHDMRVINKHIMWAYEYGIDQFICSWWGPNSFTDIAIKDYILHSPLLYMYHDNNNNNNNNKFDYSKSDNLQISILYESIGRLGPLDTNKKIVFHGELIYKLVDDMKYIAQNYFHHPNYYKINGRPVVYMYLTRTFGSGVIEAIHEVRKVLLLELGYNIYIVGDEIFWKDPNHARIKALDAITAYNMHGPKIYGTGYPSDTSFLEDVHLYYNIYRDVAESLNTAFIPGIIPGYNDRSVRFQKNNYIIPHEINEKYKGTGQYTTFNTSLYMAASVVDPKLQTITITSFNEWHEDTNIEPTILTQPSSSTTPKNYTMGYTYESYHFKLLETLQQFLLSYR